VRNSVLLLFQRVEGLTKILIDEKIPFPVLEPETQKAFEMLLEDMHLPSCTLSNLKNYGKVELRQIEEEPFAGEILDLQTTVPIDLESNVIDSYFPLVAETYEETRTLDSVFAIPSASYSDQIDTGQANLWNGESPNWPWSSVDMLPISPSSWPLGVVPPLDFTAVLTNASDISASAKLGGQCNPEGFESERSDEEEAPDEVVEDLSARFGSMQVALDGQLRYYGATSSFHLHEKTLEPSPSPAQPRPARNKQLRQELLDQVHLGQDPSLDIENHLINLYFTWENSNIRIVQREIFESARVSWEIGKEDPNYSLVLLNAM
jgi:hypothetical protein